jgi:phage-related protein (TIGR01555 family)
MPRNSRGRFQAGTSGNPGGTQSAGAAIPDIGSLKSRPTHDGTWSSALTNLGTDRDKRMSHTYGGKRLTYQQIADLWERDGIACKAIEAPSFEAFRPGYEIVLGDKDEDDDFKEQVEEALEDLGVDDAIDLAWQYKRAYGGSAIYLGTDDSSKLDEPLDLNKVRSLDYLTVFEPMELVPEDPSGDLSKYGRPQYYRINSNGSYLYGGEKGKSGSKVKTHRPAPHSRIHESRLMVFEGIKTSRYLQTSNEISPYFGTSVMDRFFDPLRDCGIGFSSAAVLATDVGQPVIRIPGLLQMVAKEEKKLVARMQAIELSRSTARAILLDEKETYERQTTQLSGIPDLLDRLSVWCSANIDIPLSVLLGYSPSSLGQPGLVELVLWYNKLRAMQRRQLTPRIKLIARLKMRTMRQRKLPKRFGIEWFPLETLNEKDQAEARLNQARADALMIEFGALDPDELRKSRWTGRYSYETSVDIRSKAPGFAAPLPTGVGGVAPAGSEQARGGATSTTTVTAYARRNPTASTSKTSSRTSGRKDQISELEYAIARMNAAIAAGAPEHVIQAHRYVVEYERAAEELKGTLKTDDDGAGDHITFAGMQVCIESSQGSTREWTDTDGTTGSTTMKFDYGYVVGSRGTDGDSVDVYLGPNQDARWVYVVHQNSKASGFAEYDEDKVMLGFDTPNAARAAYLEQYDDERFFGSMTMMTVEQFRLKIFAEPNEKVAA